MWNILFKTYGLLLSLVLLVCVFVILMNCCGIWSAKWTVETCIFAVSCRTS